MDPVAAISHAQNFAEVRHQRANERPFPPARVKLPGATADVVMLGSDVDRSVLGGYFDRSEVEHLGFRLNEQDASAGRLETPRRIPVNTAGAAASDKA
jgi:hypothetical protein